jgi:CheY-like chemotaxis protein
MPLLAVSFGGPSLFFGTLVIFGLELLDYLASRSFTSLMGSIVAMVALVINFWDPQRKRREQELKLREQELKRTLADRIALSDADRRTIEGLQAEQEKFRYELAQANAEILRNKGSVTYSGRRIPLRPPTPPSLLEVLIVEDDPPTRQALAKVLGHYDYRVTVAGEAGEAIEQVRRRERVGPKFDFVVLDLILPDGNGLDVLKAVRAGSPGTDVIVTSGSIDEAVLLEAQSHAAVLLVKPVDLNELLALLGCINGDHAPSENSHP